MDKKRYSPPRVIQYVPDQVPETVIQLFRDDLPPATCGGHRVAPANVVDSEVFYRLNLPVKENGWIQLFSRLGNCPHDSISVGGWRTPARISYYSGHATVGAFRGRTPCSLGLMFAYFLWKQHVRRKYL